MKFGLGKSKAPVATEEDFLRLIIAAGRARNGGNPVESLTRINGLIENETNRQILDRSMILGFLNAAQAISDGDYTQPSYYVSGLTMVASIVLKDSVWQCASEVLWTYYLATGEKPTEALERAAAAEKIIAEKGINAPGDWKLVLARGKAMAYDNLAETEPAVRSWEEACAIKETGGTHLFSLAGLYYGLGDAYANAERWDDALLAFQKSWVLLQAANPDSESSATVAYEAAFAALKLNETTSAIQFLSQACQIRERLTPNHPDLPEMRETLAKLQAKHGG